MALENERIASAAMRRALEFLHCAADRLGETLYQDAWKYLRNDVLFSAACPSLKHTHDEENRPVPPVGVRS